MNWDVVHSHALSFLKMDTKRLPMSVKYESDCEYE